MKVEKGLAPTTAIEAITINNLHKHYPGIKALDGLSFKIYKGGIHGLLGPNGAGKTTTMRILTGLIPAMRGEVRFFGEERFPLAGTVAKRGFAKLVGYLPENPPLYLDMRVREYLTFSGEIHGIERAKLKTAVAMTMERTGLSEVAGRFIGNLSKGFRQRVGIAMVLVYDPQIMIMDEPTIGLDPESLVEIRTLIRELAGERTILFSTHQLNEVSTLCSNITIVNAGKTLFSGSKQSLQELQGPGETSLTLEDIYLSVIRQGRKG